MWSVFRGGRHFSAARRSYDSVPLARTLAPASNCAFRYRIQMSIARFGASGRAAAHLHSIPLLRLLLNVCVIANLWAPLTTRVTSDLISPVLVFRIQQIVRSGVGLRSMCSLTTTKQSSFPWLFKCNTCSCSVFFLQRIFFIVISNIKYSVHQFALRITAEKLDSSTFLQL